MPLRGAFVGIRLLTDRLRHVPDVAQAFAASVRLILSLLSPQHNFLRQVTAKSVMAPTFVYKRQLARGRLGGGH
ncbi:hypothetical protein BIY28_18855 [Brenneria goodwinii]|nr:hypothetical protein BIY28_18855 [Brenneria goodwinii]